MINFRQCVLVNGDNTMTTWIPEKFAVVDKILCLKAEEGWKVKEVGIKQTEEYVYKHSQDYKHQRKASDI